MKSRRSWKKFLAVSLCAFCLQAPAAALSDPVPVMAEAKSGIQKEKGKIYFYENGQRVRNTWKNVKEVKKGKTVVSRYYFGANGAAYAGKKVFGVNVPAVKKINGKVYGFGTEGRMLKGIYVVNGKFFVFDSKTGVVNPTKSARLRVASAYEKDASQLRSLLGRPKKTKVMESCYGDGDDLILNYGTFYVNVFRNRQGKEIVLGVSGI